jgi:catechol 2,3-dioxygenase-like lactoylglutathione lyase family enzyme
MAVKMTGLDNVGIVVRDLDASLTFYEDVLGCTVDRGYEGRGVAKIHAGPVRFYMVEAKEPGETGRGDAFYENPVGIDHLTFGTDDVDAFYEAATAKGASFFMTPNDAPFGARVCGLHDPSGMPVYVLKWPEA